MYVEFFDCSCRLELVDKDSPRNSCAESVYRNLSNVAVEGSTNGSPKSVEVDYRLLFTVGCRHLVGVLAEQLGVVETNGSDANGLHLQQGSLAVEPKVTVSAAHEEVLLADHRDLAVLEVLPACGTLVAPVGRLGIPLILREPPVSSTALQATVTTSEQSYIPRPVLPLAVVLMSLRPDDLGLHARRVAIGDTSFDAEVDSARTPVIGC